MVELPITDAAAQRWRTTLDGVRYGLRLEWRERLSSWFLSLYTGAWIPLEEGRRLVPDYPVFRRLRDDRRPTGGFLVIDLEGTGADLARDAFSSGRARLVYLSREELEAAETAESITAIVASVTVEGEVVFALVGG